MSNRDPNRFKEYIELPDNSGFTLEGQTHVYKYDEEGGWYDEFGDYYNCQGELVEVADIQPNETDAKVEDKEVNDYEDEYDSYLPSKDVEREFQNQSVTHTTEVLRKIGKNLAKLEGHPKGEPLRVQFEILDLEDDDEQPTEDEILRFYTKVVPGIINVFYDDVDEEEDGVFGYFVMKDSHAANKLINMEGENVVGFDFTFDVETFEELALEPLGKNELKPVEKTKYVGLDSQSKIYLLIIEGGFSCKPKVFNEWMKGLSIPENSYEIIKTKKSKDGSKVPVLKISQQQVEKISKASFEGKPVTLDPYVPKEKPDQKEEEVEAQGGEKPETEEGEKREAEGEKQQAKEEENKEQATS